jgi:hypothetical protein
MKLPERRATGVINFVPIEELCEKLFRRIANNSKLGEDEYNEYARQMLLETIWAHYGRAGGDFMREHQERFFKE